MNKQIQEGKKIRPIIKQSIEDKISPFSILSSVGFMVSPDEADFLKEYERTQNDQHTR